METQLEASFPSEVWHRFPPATSDAVASAEDETGFVLPQDYRTFLLWSNGGEGQIGQGYLYLWQVGRLGELNKLYGIQRYLPNRLCIGTDGGDIAFIIDYSDQSSPRFGMVPLGDLDVNSTSMLGEAFLSSVRRFGDEAIKDNPEQLVDVFLHDLGNDRIKALAVIRRETGLSLNKVRKLIDPLPCVLIDNIPLIRAEKIVQNLRSKGASASVSD